MTVYSYQTDAFVSGVATDAAHYRKSGITQYRAIDLRTGLEIFYETIGNRTVNIGEFLGVVDTVKYIIENGYHPQIIYTNSVTAINWFMQKSTASKKNYSALYKAEIFLKALLLKLKR